MFGKRKDTRREKKKQNTALPVSIFSSHVFPGNLSNKIAWYVVELVPGDPVLCGSSVCSGVPACISSNISRATQLTSQRLVWIRECGDRSRTLPVWSFSFHHGYASSRFFRYRSALHSMELVKPPEDKKHKYDASNNSSTVACVFVTAVTFLPSCCLAVIGGFLPSRCLAMIRGLFPNRCLVTIGGYTDSNVIS
jgi:hypothetical protein